MKVVECLDASLAEIEAKAFNIIIPVCLGNKFFVVDKEITENLKEYIKYAIKKTKDRVIVLIADKIQDTNYIVRNKSHSELANIRRVLKEGAMLKNIIKNLISKEFDKDSSKIDVICWEEYATKDLFCKKNTHLVYKEFKNNPEFANKILETIKTTVTDREFSEQEYLKLCDYILDEFSVCYSGLYYDGRYYGLIMYPRTDSTVDFLQGMKNGKYFSSLYKKLSKEKLAYLIIN